MNSTNTNIEDLQQKILSKIESYEKRKKQRQKVGYAFITAFLLFISIGSLFYQNSQKQFDTQVKYEYLTENMDDYDLMDLADDEEYDINTDIDTEEIIDYVAEDPFVEFYLNNQ